MRLRMAARLVLIAIAAMHLTTRVQRKLTPLIEGAS
jgi:hypothetical protein